MPELLPRETVADGLLAQLLLADPSHDELACEPATAADEEAMGGWGAEDRDPSEARQYYRARYYDPKIGRFLSEDPIRWLGGDVNFYAYVENNPVNDTDPSGLRPGKTGWRPTAPTCGAIIGAKSFQVMKQGGTRFTHCWASCEIAKACGQQAAQQWETIKEWYDWGVCGLPGFNGNCNSAFQPDDYYDNQTGRSCPASQGCWERCQPLFGAPDPPPGPFGRS